MYREISEKLVTFIKKSPTAFHAVDNMKKELNDNGYQELLEGQKCLKPFLVPTGIKAYMKDDEFLMLANRSSSPLKRSLILPNGVGIIDADYYNNPNNEGEIFVQLVNFGLKDQLIKKGDRIGQGIFLPYLVADNDEGGKETRTGGFGSSGK